MEGGGTSYICALSCTGVMLATMRIWDNSDTMNAPRPSLLDLYFCFQSIALRSFGGVLPWTRLVLVEERKWLTAEEFADLLNLCQFVPGPNVGNLTIVVGSRFRGIPGAVAALLGLTLIPFVIAIGLGVLYARYGQIPTIRGIIDGTAAAAAGLIGGMALKMAEPLQRSRSLRGLLFLALSFIGVGIMRWHLALVMLVLAPLSIFATKKAP